MRISSPSSAIAAMIAARALTAPAVTSTSAGVIGLPNFCVGRCGGGVDDVRRGNEAGLADHEDDDIVHLAGDVQHLANPGARQRLGQSRTRFHSSYPQCNDTIENLRDPPL